MYIWKYLVICGDKILTKNYGFIFTSLFQQKFNKSLTSILLVANSTPIVDLDSKLNSFLVNLDKRLLFPTPESPINTTEIRIW